jgi:hypothetical protein
MEYEHSIRLHPDAIPAIERVHGVHTAIVRLELVGTSSKWALIADNMENTRRNLHHLLYGVYPAMLHYLTAVLKTVLLKEKQNYLTSVQQPSSHAGGPPPMVLTLQINLKQLQGQLKDSL